jgi:hypothetical protein
MYPCQQTNKQAKKKKRGKQSPNRIEIEQQSNRRQEQKKQTKNATEKKSLKEIPNFEINNFQKESESSNSE